ncbi:MAG: zinc ribbon domain-containing protein [Candidatus Accumulibacter sp.]|jgi:membrane protease subunit (stomatin/prohibitin family)|nr:zinc ribbon domain-containing protein [Accumulibacter sp.]
MAFFDTLGDIVRNIGDKATDALETTKLNTKINAEKTAIAECMRRIGEYYHAKHQAGEPDDSGVAEIHAAIDGHNAAIAETQAEITRIQAENAAQAARAAAAVPAATAAPAAGEIVCPSCGKANVPGTKFCRECGGKLEIPVAPVDRACPGCGAPVPATSRFCGECGYKFE